MKKGDILYGVAEIMNYKATAKNIKLYRANIEGDKINVNSVRYDVLSSGDLDLSKYLKVIVYKPGSKLFDESEIVTLTKSGDVYYAESPFIISSDINYTKKLVKQKIMLEIYDMEEIMKNKQKLVYV